MPGPTAPTPEFLDAAKTLGVEFEAGDLERLGRFLHLLLEANQTTNLTAITDPAQAWTKHVLDALTLVPVFESLEGSAGKPEGDGITCIDIGSGGGVPAMPLAIVLPRVKFVLVEATGKKVEFLRSAIEQLGLKNATVIQERAEKLGQMHKEHRERYDIAIARALGHLAVVAELCGPLVRRDGLVVAVKGAKAEQELAEAGKALGLIGLRHFETILTPTGRLVVLEKATLTPRTYPRRDGEPARVPLGMGSDSKPRRPD